MKKHHYSTISYQMALKSLDHSQNMIKCHRMKAERPECGNIESSITKVQKRENLGGKLIELPINPIILPM